jgi:dTDP-4-dehydrorhamnose reductase
VLKNPRFSAAKFNYKLFYRKGKKMILLTGANGQLGTDFKRIFDKIGVKYIATDYQELDITDKNAIEDFVKNKEIEIIINCAAYNNVDKAEEEKDKAYALNCSAPQNLAKIAKQIEAIFVTYSTDFVFDGEKDTPYTEEDNTHPLSTYGMSKLDGEKVVLDTYNKSFVIRTSWVFGIGNNNFNTQVINWSKNRDELNIVDDQVSVPTYSYDLAEFSWELIKTKKYGLYHLSNSGVCSKYDQAKYVLDKIGWNGKLGRAKTADFNLPAKRAKYSKLDSTKAEKIIGKTMPTWQNAIDRYLEEFLATNDAKKY